MFKKIRGFVYGTEERRILMRFIEIFVVAGVSALLNSVELQNAFTAAFGAGVAAMLLKLLRDLTKDE